MPMLSNPATKYRAYPVLNLPDRTWPNKTITHAPIWCSSDLRDGNQSLIEPMSPEKKLRFFKTLVAVGVKEIEVAFPSASQTDFDFVRLLIEDGHIPEDTTIQVLTQAREDLIARTFESLKGAPKAIVHMYNAVSPAFRRIVFNQDKAGVKAIAVHAAQLFQKYAAMQPETQWTFEYSPETFSATETPFAVEVCNAVLDVWQPNADNKVILNLPATVEVATPNVYADQIEWFARNIDYREHVIISLHTHNDRGTGVAASELGLLAGADRVEGCLFGNGERTGNVDLVTLALNLYSQGVSPGLDFSDIDRVRKLVEECNQLPVHPRHPYAGELVFTAFSGSHQDAIKKGLAVQKKDAIWEVPYLPIDPADVNRSYDAVVRVNSQSGKGGVSFLLQQEAGLQLPRRLQIEFSNLVQKVSDRTGKEVKSADIVQLFEQEYLSTNAPFSYRSSKVSEDAERLNIVIDVEDQQEPVSLFGQGNGPIDAAAHALSQHTGTSINVVDYHEHAMGEGSDVVAVCYVELKVGQNKPVFGIGKDSNIVAAAIKALLNGVNRHLKV